MKENDFSSLNPPPDLANSKLPKCSAYTPTHKLECKGIAVPSADWWWTSEQLKSDTSKAVMLRYQGIAHIRDRRDKSTAARVSRWSFQVDIWKASTDPLHEIHLLSKWCCYISTEINTTQQQPCPQIYQVKLIMSKGMSTGQHTAPQRDCRQIYTWKMSALHSLVLAHWGLHFLPTDLFPRHLQPSPYSPTPAPGGSSAIFICLSRIHRRATQPNK